MLRQSWSYFLRLNRRKFFPQEIELYTIQSFISMFTEIQNIPWFCDLLKVSPPFHTRVCGSLPPCPHLGRPVVGEGKGGAERGGSGLAAIIFHPFLFFLGWGLRWGCGVPRVRRPQPDNGGRGVGCVEGEVPGPEGVPAHLPASKEKKMYILYHC